MSNNEEDLYCKLFIDANIEESSLFGLITSSVSGSEELPRTVVAEYSEMDLVRNDDFDDVQRLNPDEGFLYYRYYLDIVPKDESYVDRRGYIAEISGLMNSLRGKGYSVVAASDFEDELPR